MARQRFIHPSLWTDPSFCKLNSEQKLMFIGLFSHADDEGRMFGDAAYLRSILFPREDITIKKVTALRDAVVAAFNSLTLYTVEESEFLAFTKWSEHQKPKYPTPSKLPAPPENDSPKVGGSLTEDSTSPSTMGWVGKGRDRDGDGLGSDKGASRPDPQAASAAKQPMFNTLNRIFGEVQTSLEHSERDLCATDYIALQVDEAEIARRAANYRANHPKMPFTARAVLKRWTESDKAVISVAKQDISDRQRENTVNFYRDHGWKYGLGDAPDSEHADPQALELPAGSVYEEAS